MDETAILKLSRMSEAIVTASPAHLGPERIGGGLGPLMGGFAFGAGMPSQQIFLFAAAPLAVGLLAALLITPRYRRRIAAA